MKNPSQSRQGNSWDARTPGKAARALRKEQKTQGDAPTVIRGAWVCRHHLIQSISQHIFDKTFQVLGPDLESLGRQLLSVPVFQKAVITCCPHTAQVSNQGQVRGFTSTPTPPYSLWPSSLPHPVRLEPPFSSISHWAPHSFDLYVAFCLQGSPPWAGHHNLHFSSRLTLHQSASQPAPFSASPSDSLFLPFL